MPGCQNVREKKKKDPLNFQSGSNPKLLGLKKRGSKNNESSLVAGYKKEISWSTHAVWFVRW
jgi:hypothetical protein